MLISCRQKMLRVACGFALLQAVCASAADDFAVSIEARGAAVAVNARATLDVPYALIWSTLTDYSRLADFVPGMHSSRVVERRGASTIVEQHGKAGFLIFSSPVDVVVAATEHPSGVIEMHAIEGNVKQLYGQYRIDKGGRDGTWVLRWVGLIEPALPLPHFVGLPMIRSNIADQFRGMVDEIERRAVVAARN